MKQFYLFTLICFCSYCGQSQQTFQKIFNTAGSLNNVAVATNKDLLICSNYSYGLLVNRTASNGKIKWSKSFSNFTAGLITNTNDNGFAALCYYQQYASVLFKCDSSGNVQWAKQINSGKYEFNGYSIICQSEKGNYYISGGDFYKNFQVIKLDKKGNLIWNKSYVDKTLDFGFRPVYLSKLENDNILLTVSEVGCEFYCNYLKFLKIDANGNIQGYSLYTPYPYSSPEPVAIKEINNKISGLFVINNQTQLEYAYMNFDFEHNVANSILFFYDDFTLQEFAKSRRLKELKNTPLNVSYYKLVLEDDWSMLKAADFYPYKILLNHYDSRGRICPEYKLPAIHRKSLKSQFDLYPFNYSKDTNNIVINNFIVSVKDINNDSLVCKGTAKNSFNALDKAEQKFSVSSNVYPNPTNKFISINYYSETNQSAQIQIFTVTGTLIKSEIINLSVGNNRKSINTSSLQSGVYFLKVSTQTEGEKYKFIKE